MCETWTLAVLTLITSSLAISRFVRPRATPAHPRRGPGEVALLAVEAAAAAWR